MEHAEKVGVEMIPFRKEQVRAMRMKVKRSINMMRMMIMGDRRGQQPIILRMLLL
jgi:hypothetical protein